MLLLADPDFIPAAIMLAVLPLTFTIAWVDRQHIAPRDVGFAVAGRIPDNFVESRARPRPSRRGSGWHVSCSVSCQSVDSRPQDRPGTGRPR